MIDLSMTSDQFFIAVFALVYIIIISIAINRYHPILNKKKKLKLKFRHKLITEIELKKEIESQITQFKLLKRKSYKRIGISGALHLIIAILLGINIFYVILEFVIFGGILYSNYWLKGSSIASSLKNKPGQSDFWPN